MKKICMNVFLFVNVMLYCVSVSSLASNLDKGYFESEKAALKSDALTSKFNSFFAPRNKVWTDQDTATFAELDHPGLKDCQQVWRDCDIQDDIVFSMMANLLQDEEDVLLKQQHARYPLILSSSPVSELSGSYSSGATTSDSIVTKKSYPKMNK